MHISVTANPCAVDVIEYKTEFAPIFLVGAERSGTTLLRLMLDHHPAIRFHHEFEYAVDYVADDGTPPPMEEYAKAMEVDRIFQVSGETITPEVDYKTLVTGFLQKKLQESGKCVIGATVHRTIDRLLHLWPKARFIHLLRDPRDVARSVIQMGWAGNTWVATERWVEAEQCWDVVRKRIPTERWAEIRYEELLAEPVRELTRLCTFMGVPWSEQMLDYTKDSDYDYPNPALAYQWKRKAALRDVQLVEARLGDLLMDRGYKHSGFPAVRVSAARRCALKLNSKLNCVKFRMNRTGGKLFWQDFFARRLGLTRIARRIKQQLNELDAQMVTARDRVRR